MSLGWVSRVPRPPVSDVIRSACGVATEGYTHQSVFHYPKKGGFETLPRALAASLGEKVLTKRRVDLVKKTEGGWDVLTSASSQRSTSGKRTFDTRSYRTLVSTLPLETTLGVLGMDVGTVAGLRHNGLRVVVVGFEGKPLPYTAIYVPRPEAPYHRVCFDKGFAEQYPALFFLTRLRIAYFQIHRLGRKLKGIGSNSFARRGPAPPCLANAALRQVT